MSENITIARPYAKAIFEHALSANKLPQWSIYLKNLAYIVLDSNAAKFIDNPLSTTDQHSRLFLAIIDTVFNQLDEKFDNNELDYVVNLVSMLTDNKRLLLLPSIVVLFETLRAKQEKTEIVTVISYSHLSDKQQEQLIRSLSNRLGRLVTLELSIDKTLLGGAVIRSRNLVIDGSVRHQLNQLRTSLAV